MDIETYNRMIKAINEQLQVIADLTASQAWSGCADPSNPIFVSAINEHKRLTDLSAKLSAKMLPPTI